MHTVAVQLSFLCSLSHLPFLFFFFSPHAFLFPCSRRLRLISDSLLVLSAALLWLRSLSLSQSHSVAADPCMLAEPSDPPSSHSVFPSLSRSLFLSLSHSPSLGSTSVSLPSANLTLFLYCAHLFSKYHHFCHNPSITSLFYSITSVYSFLSLYCLLILRHALVFACICQCLCACVFIDLAWW